MSMPRRPRPQWPAVAAILTVLAGVVGTIAAYRAAGPCALVVAIPAAVFGALGIVVLVQAAARVPVWEDYQDALNLLKDSPADAELRQQALAIGREYAALTVGMDGKPQYTEAAIQNDIAAATGG